MPSKRHCRTLVFLAFIVSLLMMSNRTTADQPPQEWSTVEVPVYVLIDAQGKAELVTALWGPARGAPDVVLAKVLPESIPVFTDVGEGDLIRGVAWHSDNAIGGDRFFIEIPQSVEIAPNQSPSLTCLKQEFIISKTEFPANPINFLSLASTINAVPVRNAATQSNDKINGIAALPTIQLIRRDNVYNSVAHTPHAPAWVEYDNNNNATQISCRALPQIIRVDSIKSIPAITRAEGEPLRLGVQQINNAMVENFVAIVPYVLSIERNLHGVFTTNQGARFRTIESITADVNAGVPSQTPISGSDRIVIIPSNSAQDINRDNRLPHRGGVSFVFQNFQGSPPQEFEPNQILSAMHNSADFFACIDNSAVIRIDIIFQDSGSTSPRMGTRTDISLLTYQDTIDSLVIQAFINNETAEEFLYDSFPISTLPVDFTIGNTIQATHIFRDLSLQQAAGGLGSFDADVIVTINTNKSLIWDLNPLDGLAQGHLDFRGIFAHELIHGMGFSSILDAYATHPLPKGTIPRVLDMLRFDQLGGIGNDVNSFEFMTVPRTIERGVQSISATLKDQPQGLYEMSTGITVGALGDGYGAGHWKVAVDRSKMIGIMDGAALTGEILLPDLADYRALDILGWNLDAFNCSLVLEPVMIEILDPPDGAIDTDVAPLLQWTTNGSEDSTTVVVWDLLGAEVVQQTGVLDQFYQVPAGVLDYENTYEWAAFTVDGNAVGQSEYWSFTTEAEIIVPPECPADLNDDRVVDTADLGGLLGSFGNTGTPGTLFGDINEDGVVDTADMGILLGSFGPCPV